MKQLILLCFATILFGCQQKVDNTKDLQNQIDRLENKLSDSYKPEFGEFMSNIQIHHSKLWFAGKNENWKLADFEINEIKENLEDIQNYETDRTESQMTPMINPALDSVSNAIQQKNLIQFERSYNLLTNTCVNCHRSTNYEFIQITIPNQQTFSNQRFKLEN